MDRSTDRFRIDPITVRDLIGHSPGWRQTPLPKDLRELRREVARADEVDTPDWFSPSIPLARIEANKSGSVDFHRPTNNENTDQ